MQVRYFLNATKYIKKKNLEIDLKENNFLSLCKFDFQYRFIKKKCR